MKHFETFRQTRLQTASDDIRHDYRRTVMTSEHEIFKVQNNISSRLWDKVQRTSFTIIWQLRIFRCWIVTHKHNVYFKHLLLQASHQKLTKSHRDRRIVSMWYKLVWVSPLVGFSRSYRITMSKVPEVWWNTGQVWVIFSKKFWQRCVRSNTDN